MFPSSNIVLWAFLFASTAAFSVGQNLTPNLRNNLYLGPADTIPRENDLAVLANLFNSDETRNGTICPQLLYDAAKASDQRPKKDPEKPKKPRPTLTDVIGTFTGSSSNGWSIVRAQFVKSDDEIMLTLNILNRGQKILRFKNPSPSDTLISLDFVDKRTSFSDDDSWFFYNGFSLEFNQNRDLVLTCDRAKKAAKDFIVGGITLTLTKVVDVPLIWFPGTYEPTGAKVLRTATFLEPRARNNNNNVAVEEEVARVSRKKQKRLNQKKKRAAEFAINANANSAQAWQHELSARDDKEYEARCRRYLQLVQQALYRQTESNELVIGHDDAHSPQPTPLLPEKIRLPQAKDLVELVERAHSGVRLAKSNSQACPLASGIWVGEGDANNGTGFERVLNKQIVISLQNINGLPAYQNSSSWGSLWASSLGAAGNFSLGKNVHWSYHQQPNGDAYLNISHHYLFKINQRDDGFIELEIADNSDEHVLNQVTTYLVKEVSVANNVPDFACDYIGFTPNRKAEELNLAAMEAGHQAIMKALNESKNLARFAHGKPLEYVVSMINPTTAEIHLSFENQDRAQQRLFAKITDDHDVILSRTK